MSLLYFAYGSNLDADQVRKRLADPMLMVQERAALDGWSFKFNKHGMDGTDKANIVPEPSGAVQGCLYKLTPAQLTVLSEYEDGYAPHGVEVRCGSERRTAKTFAAAKLCDRGCGPSEAYLGVILKGARAVGLDAPYIDGIRVMGGGR